MFSYICVFLILCLTDPSWKSINVSTGKILYFTCNLFTQYVTCNKWSAFEFSLSEYKTRKLALFDVERHCVSVTKIAWLKMFKEVIHFYSKNHKNSLNTPWEQNTKFFFYVK